MSGAVSSLNELISTVGTSQLGALLAPLEVKTFQAVQNASSANTQVAFLYILFQNHQIAFCLSVSSLVTSSCISETTLLVIFK
jgi:hypothetical protein